MNQPSGNVGERLSLEAFREKYPDAELLSEDTSTNISEMGGPEKEEEVIPLEDFQKRYPRVIPLGQERDFDSREERGTFEEFLTGAPAGFTSSIEMFGRAGRTLNIPGSSWLVDMGKKWGEPFEATKTGYVPEALRSGVESTIQSILAGIPGAVVGAVAGSAIPIAGTFTGGVAGFAASAGTIFGLAEYDEFMEQVEMNARREGVPESEIESMKDDFKDEALISALAEGGFEALSDILQAKVFKLIGAKAVTAPIKRSLVKTALTYFGKTVPIELGTELATTAVQVAEREQAGIPTAGMVESLKRTVGPVLVQSILRAGGGVKATKMIENKQIADHIAKRVGELEDNIQKFETEEEAVAYGLSRKEDLTESEVSFLKQRASDLGRKVQPKVIYLGEQHAPDEESFKLYHTLVDFPGIPAGDTVTEEKLKKAGIPIPSESEEESQDFNKIMSTLSGVLGKKVSWDAEKESLKIEELDDYGYEKIVRALEGKSAKEKISYAESQIDESSWLKYFAGLGPSPMEEFMETGKKVLEDVRGESEEIEYIKPGHINNVARHLLSPEFAVRKLKRPLNTVQSFIRGELKVRHSKAQYEAWYKKLKHGLSEEEQKQVIPAMDLVYKIKRAGTMQPIFKEQLAQLYAKYPRTLKAIEGVTQKGGIIELFEQAKEELKQSMMDIKRTNLTPSEFKVVEDILAGFKEARGKKAAEESVKENIDTSRLAREKYNRINKSGNAFARLSGSETKKKERAMFRSILKKLMKEANEVQEIEKWGLRDYITHIEEGSYRILDDEGNTRGMGRTDKEAKRKAFQIRQEEAARTGKKIPKFHIEFSFNRINPTKHSKDIFKGEKNIFKILPRYTHSMVKRTILEPIRAQYFKDRKDFPKEYTADVRNIVNMQMHYLFGEKYSLADKIADDISAHFGWESGKYSKAVSQIRKVTANLKLGYRLTSAMINALGGFGNTWVYAGTKYFAKGTMAWKSGKYIAPDGQEIDIKKKVADAEKEGGFGFDLAVSESGEFDRKIKIWKPLGLFQLPEKFIRPHSFITNYIYQREVLKKNDFEATEAALQGVRFQQFTYNIAALPNILRSPTAKLIGQFKTYLVKELEFISTLRGKQIPRMVGLQLMMGGPRGAIYLLKSLPLLGSLGLLDDAEKWMVKGEGTIANIASRGIGGVVGADITAPAVLQLPSRPEDWGGPFIGDSIRLFNDVIIPALQSAGGGPGVAYIQDDAIQWLAGLVPIGYYLKDLYKSMLTWETAGNSDLDSGAEKLLKQLGRPNVWIRDSSGNKAYKVGGLQDRLLLLSGAAPIKKSQYQVLKSIWSRDQRIRSENRRKWYTKVTKKLIKGKPITPDLFMDGIKYQVDPNQIPTSYMYKQLSPRLRETLRARLFEKAEALDHFGL